MKKISRKKKLAKKLEEIKCLSVAKINIQTNTCNVYKTKIKMEIK